MNIKQHCIALFTSLALALTTSAAEKVKPADVTGHPFYSSPKRGDVPQFVPGLNAVLQLTPAQKEQIAAAREEMRQDAALQAAQRLSKNDPSVTPEQRERARAATQAATARLREKVSAILTAEQKALIEKLNQTHALAAEDTAITFEPQLVAAKGDDETTRRLRAEAQQEVLDLFRHKLTKVLTVEQQAAMASAAEDEERHLAASTAIKKPAK